MPYPHPPEEARRFHEMGQFKDEKEEPPSWDRLDSSHNSLTVEQKEQLSKGNYFPRKFSIDSNAASKPNYPLKSLLNENANISCMDEKNVKLDAANGNRHRKNGMIPVKHASLPCTTSALSFTGPPLKIKGHALLCVLPDSTLFSGIILPHSSFPPLNANRGMPNIASSINNSSNSFDILVKRLLNPLSSLTLQDLIAVRDGATSSRPMRHSLPNYAGGEFCHISPTREKFFSPAGISMYHLKGSKCETGQPSYFDTYCLRGDDLFISPPKVAECNTICDCTNTTEPNENDVNFVNLPNGIKKFQAGGFIKDGTTFYLEDENQDEGEWKDSTLTRTNGPTLGRYLSNVTDDGTNSYQIELVEVDTPHHIDYGQVNFNIPRVFSCISNNGSTAPSSNASSKSSSSGEIKDEEDLLMAKSISAPELSSNYRRKKLSTHAQYFPHSYVDPNSTFFEDLKITGDNLRFEPRLVYNAEQADILIAKSFTKDLTGRGCLVCVGEIEITHPSYVSETYYDHNNIHDDILPNTNPYSPSQDTAKNNTRKDSFQPQIDYSKDMAHSCQAENALVECNEKPDGIDLDNIDTCLPASTIFNCAGSTTYRFPKFLKSL